MNSIHRPCSSIAANSTLKGLDWRKWWQSGTRSMMHVQESIDFSQVLCTLSNKRLFLFTHCYWELACLVSILANSSHFLPTCHQWFCGLCPVMFFRAWRLACEPDRGTRDIGRPCEKKKKSLWVWRTPWTPSPWISKVLDICQPIAIRLASTRCPCGKVFSKKASKSKILGAQVLLCWGP